MDGYRLKHHTTEREGEKGGVRETGNVTALVIKPQRPKHPYNREKMMKLAVGA